MCSERTIEPNHSIEQERSEPKLSNKNNPYDAFTIRTPAELKYSRKRSLNRLDINLKQILFSFRCSFEKDDPSAKKRDPHQASDCTQASALQAHLDRLSKWAAGNESTFNESKCVVMHYDRNNAEADYFLNGYRLEKTVSERYLGVVSSSDLSSNKQVN